MITITNVDLTTADYPQYRVSGDKAIFHGPAATDLSTDLISVKSLAPKRGNGQYGNRRTTISLVRGTNVVDLDGGSVVLDRKFAVESSLPVGTTEAQIIEDAHNLGSLLQDPVFVAKAFKEGIIEY